MSFRGFYRTITAILVIALAACEEKAPSGGGAKPGAEAREIRLGVVGSLTGSNATFGNSTKNGIDLAVKQTNAKGGIGGRQIKAIHLDDQGKPEEAKTAAQRLITQDKVHVLLGEVASSASLAMAPVAQRARIPMITPSSTNPAVTEIGDFIFRVCFIDPFQGFVMAKFAAEDLKLKKIAILRDIRNDYSVGLANVFSEELKKLGGTIVADESYAQGDTDYKATLTKIRGASPEAIYVPGYYTEVGQIARQARELKIDVPLLGGDGWDSDKLFEGGGKAVDGSYFSNHYHVDDPRESIKSFVRDYRAEYNETPDALAALGYEAAMVAVHAIEKTGGTDPQKLRDVIAALKGFPAVTGAITLDDKRNAIKPAVVIQIKEGKRTFVTQISPPGAAPVAGTATTAAAQP
ncbi:MAG: ABC transporter substrate-binding protein [Deltaproteobacteria bacterium]|nr:ABC transporter substrate-binding protein [Deltaproteobacteria bacterium]